MTDDLCLLCRASLEYCVSAPDRQLGHGIQHSVWRCRQCGLGHTWPRLSATALSTSYASHYPPFWQMSTPAQGWRQRLSATALAGFGYVTPEALPLPHTVVRGLASIRSWVWQPPPPPPGRLLDVGCGSGAYGASLRRLGWQVDGIEPDTDAAARAVTHGVHVLGGDVRDISLAPASYHVITLWHTLEHVSDPMSVLKALRPALRAGGYLWIETPNWTGWGFRWTGRKWFHLDLPRHRYHFTPHSLCKLLRLTGYQVTDFRHIPNPHGLSGIVPYQDQDKPSPPAGMARTIGWGLGIMAALLRQADILRLKAQVSRPLEEGS